MYVVHFTQAAAVEHATSLLRGLGRSLRASRRVDRPGAGADCERCSRTAGRRTVRGRVRQDAVEAAAPGDRGAPRRDAAALPTAGGAARPGGAAHGHLRHRHPRRRASTCRSARCCSPRWRSSTGTSSGCCAPGSSCRSPAAPGRPGFDTAGYVVVQAPEHVIENEKAKAKADAKNAALREHQRAKREVEGAAEEATRGHGGVDARQTFDKLVAGEPEPLRSRMKVDNAMLVNVVAREEDAFARDAPAADGQPRGPAYPAAARPTGAAAGPQPGAQRGAEAAGGAGRVRPPLRAHRRAARGLRAQPAAGAVRDRRAGPARRRSRRRTSSTSSR